MHAAALRSSLRLSMSLQTCRPTRMVRLSVSLPTAYKSIAAEPRTAAVPVMYARVKF